MANLEKQPQQWIDSEDLEPAQLDMFIAIRKEQVSLLDELIQDIDRQRMDLLQKRSSYASDLRALEDAKRATSWSTETRTG